MWHSSPGWFNFLSSVATKYEMHVYTMGTRAYAEEVCKAIDPDGNIFCGRVLSRDESGSECVVFDLPLFWLTYYKASHRRACSGYFLLTRRWSSSSMTARMFGNGAQIWSKSSHVRTLVPLKWNSLLTYPQTTFL